MKVKLSESFCEEFKRIFQQVLLEGTSVTEGEEDDKAIVVESKDIKDLNEELKRQKYSLKENEIVFDAEGTLEITDFANAKLYEAVTKSLLNETDFLSEFKQLEFKIEDNKIYDVPPVSKDLDKN